VASIRLVPWSREHVPAVAELVLDPDTLRFTLVPDPPPEGFAERWLERYESGRRDGTREAWAIVGDDGELLGLCMAPVIEREARTVELGYVIAPAARGRGVATEALRLMTEWALDEVGAERIELRISVANAGSRKVAERAGYVREGVLRNTYFKQGRRDDTEIWSVVPSDRPRLPSGR
jgi:RimJ/RimL family protein N-acetyltransferase